MKVASILLALDGSIYSRYAAECAWRLAKQTGARVTALHVIDIENTWGFVGHDQPGFLPKEEYQALYDLIVDDLGKLGTDLAESYGSEAKKQGIDVHVILEEGDPYTQICKRAMQYDIVIIGHRPNAAASDNRHRRQYHRLSVAESLSHGCPKPLMVVQAPVEDWQTSTMLSTAEHINERYLDRALELIQQISLQPSLVVFASGVREEPADHLVRDIRASDKRLAQVPIAVFPIEDCFASDEPFQFDNPGRSDDRRRWDDWAKTLVIVPTRELAGKRSTLFGSSPAMFVRWSTLPALLLWPEDHPHLIKDNPVKSEAAHLTV